MYKRLYRSKSDAILGGVAGGIAEYLNLDPTVVRLLIVLLAVATSGFPVVLAYVILWAITPRSP